MKAALAKILKDVAKKKVKKKIANASSFFSGEEGITGIVALSAPLIPILIATVIVIGAIMLPILLVNQYIQDASASEKILFEDLNGLLVLSDWCKPGDANCEKQATQKYYEELEEVYNKYKEKNVEIDVQLITATIFYANTHRNDLFTESDDSTDIEEGNIKLSDIDRLASNMVNGNSIDYDKYRNYLISTYIPKRFSELYADRDDKENAIEEIADAIMGFKNENATSSNQVASNCKFNEQEKLQVNIDKSYIENVKINTLYPYYHNFNTENASERDVEYTISLKEYVTGVVYREIHAGLSPMTDETIKANLVAIKSYTLDRHPAIEKNGKYYITMRNNTDDQVYCNLDKGCRNYSTYGESNLLDPAPADVKQLLYKLYDETFDEYIYNTATNKFMGAYTATKAICVSIGAPTNCMSQNESIEMGNKGNDYKAILMSFYTDNAGLININSSTISKGAYACAQTTYMGGGKYSSNAPRYDNSSDFFANINYNYFLPPSYEYYGECPWYAKGRAIEIMANSNIPDELKNKRIDFLRGMLGNGADWYSNPSNELFSKSEDLYAAKPGSIVSWKGGGVSCPESPMGLCGHVGIIEDVEYDSNGKATRVLLSDGWNNRANGTKVAAYAYRWLDMEALKRYSTRTTYYFNGYVYLLD